jgi:hypothetical protein
MREHVLLFCLLGLVFTAAIILVAAPGAVTWALALIGPASAGLFFSVQGGTESWRQHMPEFGDGTGNLGTGGQRGAGSLVWRAAIPRRITS